MDTNTASVRLDPAIPRVWRTPTDLQFGVDVPVLLLHQVSSAQERLIAALDGGVTPGGLEMLAQRAGADAGTASRLLETLGPVLERPPAEPAADAPRIVIRAHGTAGAILAHLLRLAGYEPDCGEGPPEDAAGPQPPAVAAVLLADFVIDPREAGYWLRRDVPHLPIVFADSGVRVGPLVRAGEGPCIRCLQLAATDSDVAWPAIATQLAGRTAPSHSGDLDLDAAIAAVSVIRARPGCAWQVDSTHSVLLGRAGRFSVRHHRRHPRCGCAALPGSARALEVGADPIPQPS